MSRRIAPVRLGMARWVRAGSLPACHAITPSTAASGSVWSHARTASARPCEIRNCAASAPHATRNAESSMDGNVHSAVAALPATVAKRAMGTASGLTFMALGALSSRAVEGSGAPFPLQANGAMPQVIVTRRTHFNAAHRLFNPAWSEAENARVFGPCANPNYHGHNYNLDVSVIGPVYPETGYVVDIKTLKDLVETHVLSKFDHRKLNLDVPEFAKLMPTAENI